MSFKKKKRLFFKRLEIRRIESTGWKEFFYIMAEMFFFVLQLFAVMAGIGLGVLLLCLAFEHSLLWFIALFVYMVISLSITAWFVD